MRELKIIQLNKIRRLFWKVSNRSYGSVTRPKREESRFETRNCWRGSSKPRFERIEEQTRLLIEVENWGRESRLLGDVWEQVLGSPSPLN